MAFRVAALVLLVSCCAATSGANDIWLLPTYQRDLGGVGTAVDAIWPATAAGLARFVLAVPNDFQTLRSAAIAVIPTLSSPTAILTSYSCSARAGDAVSSSCDTPQTHQFVAVANHLAEIDVTQELIGRIGDPGNGYASILAFTSPTTLTDHIVGLRISYDGAPTVQPFQRELTLVLAAQGTTTSNSFSVPAGTRFVVEQVSAYTPNNPSQSILTFTSTVSGVTADTVVAHFGAGINTILQPIELFADSGDLRVRVDVVQGFRLGDSDATFQVTVTGHIEQLR